MHQAATFPVRLNPSIYRTRCLKNKTAAKVGQHKKITTSVKYSMLTC